MRLKKDSTDKKLRGAYYTPLRLADAMVGLFMSNEFNHILEPSCGDGVFLDSLFAAKLLHNYQNVTAIEIEKEEADKVIHRYKDETNIKVLNEDFFDFYKRNCESQKYDLILGNPPYIRYQYLTTKQREVQSRILTSHGMKSNKLINSWVGFLVACIQMLSDNGKIAFVLPAEILQVAYAEDLRLFLSNQLQRITLITFEKLIFPDIEQEVIILFGEKGGEEKGIRIIEMERLDDFENVNLNKNGFQKLQHIKEKWTKYFISSEEISVIQALRNDNRFFKFSECGVINVGITTGNNDYFSIDKKTADKYSLEPISLPLIGRSSHANGIFFTREDWQMNFDNGKKAMLVNFPDIPLTQYPKQHQKYIATGEKSKQNKGYKCSIRGRWYMIPSVWIPDAFFLRRNNLYPKFVLNKCNAVSTDTMHRIKFKIDTEPENILLSYYNSISFAFTEICGRSYGGGVLEILPREMGNIILPKIKNINIELRDNLLKRVNEIVENQKNIELALDIVDSELLISTLGIDANLCKKCRAIWRKLQQRRLGRT